MSAKRALCFGRGPVYISYIYQFPAHIFMNFAAYTEYQKCSLSKNPVKTQTRKKTIVFSGLSCIM